MTLSTDGDIIKIGEAATKATIKDSIAIQRQRPVGADGEARGGWPLDRVVELKLVVCNDLTGTAVLVSEDTILESDDGIGGADGFGLVRDVLGDVVGGDFEGAGIVFVAAVAHLSRDSGSQSGEEGKGSEGLHGDDVLLKWEEG